MNLEDARAAKHELRMRLPRGEIQRYADRVALVGGPGQRALSAQGDIFAAALGAEGPSDAPTYAISLGVSVHREGGFGVAVRVQAARASRPIAEALRAVFKEESEVDFRMIGTVRTFKPWYRDIARPLCIGPSVGHHHITAGTLGAFVSVKGKDGEYMLSNNHVLANVDRANTGDLILQPGPLDNLAPDQLIVGIFDSAVPLKRDDPNLVDCAIARVNPGIEISPSHLWNVGELTGLIPPDQLASDLVFKIGRTTGLSWGRVTAIELDPIEINMDTTVYAFENQIEIEGTGNSAFSRPGDSGSLVVDTHRQAVGLLFAGSTSGGSNGKGLTYVNPIDDVVTNLNASLVF